MNSPRRFAIAAALLSLLVVAPSRADEATGSNELIPKLRERGAAISEELVEIRRQIHMHPELAGQPGEGAGRPPRPDEEADVLRRRHVEHERQVGDGGQAGGPAQQHDPRIEDRRAGEQTAQQNQHEGDDPAPRGEVGHTAF